MKKVLLGLFALSAISMAATGDSYLNVRVGGDLKAEYSDVKEDGVTLLSEDTDGLGGELALEYYYSLTNNFDLGLGIAYQIHADREDASFYDLNYTDDKYTISGAEYKSIPLYVTTKYKFITKSGINPYLKANLGYSFNFDASDGKIKETYLTTGGDYKTINESFKLEADNGLYWAIGGGIEYKNFTVDLMYALTTAELEDDDNEKEDADYARFVLSAGYKFNL